MDKLTQQKNKLARRKMRIKKSLRKNKELPRLCISRSNKYISAQIIDDIKRTTMVGASSAAKDFPEMKNKKNIDAAKELGKIVAEKAKAQGITKVIFDRNGYLYHGKIKAFADAARENGLEF
jgi:large subunit ribosomal protein L18